MVYPKKISSDAKIEIISPSNGIKMSKIEKYERALLKLKEYGFDVLEDKYVRNSHNGVSSSAKNRAYQLNKALKNTCIDALIACSGGDYLIQILDLISFKNIEVNPKWIQGHSDITALLYYVTTKYDIATIYSFNAKTFGEKNVPEEMIKNNIKFLKGQTPVQTEYGYKLEDEQIDMPWKCITDFQPIKGRIIGGCLPCLKDIIGTKYDKTKAFIEKYKEDGIIWYFDIVELSNEDILRTMWQLKQAKWFKYCKGILIGRLENEVTYTDTSLEDALKYNLSDLNVPIIINFDIGHTDPVFTIINGSIVKINKQEKYKMETILE